MKEAICEAKTKLRSRNSKEGFDVKELYQVLLNQMCTKHGPFENYIHFECSL